VHQVDAAVEEALRVNQGDILNYLTRRVDSPDDAADLFGDTYATAWRRRKSMPADAEGARKWLFVVARNTLLNHRRSARRSSSLTTALRGELQRVAAVDAENDERLAVQEAIAALEPEQAELVRLVHWDRMTLADAADVIGIPASTARSRYAIARARLQELLALVP
jgi:RNA polymerase sigma-70 factor (ECF subfamily)